MPISKEQHQKDIKQFTAERKHFKVYADILKEILEEVGKLYAPLSIVQTRAKDVSSFAEKIIRKDKYKNPLVDITDLCGGRIITQTQEQILKVCQFIRENFIIDEANSLDVSDRLRTSEFGYRSVHFIVSPMKDEILGVKIPEKIKGKKAEIQVRTLLQHTWADILHDRLYKTALKVPKEWGRESARLAALLENADENISRITTLTDSYTANYGNQMNEELLNREIDTLKTILGSEPDTKKKPVLALKIAKLAKFTGKWDLIIENLSNYKKTDSRVIDEIQLELGYALCKKYRSYSNSIKFKQGKKMIAVVEKSKKDTDEALSLKITALHYLAEINKGIESDDTIKEYCKAAYEMEPENPYLLAKVLEYNKELCENLLMVKQPIKKAIKQCNEDIILGIESLNAYFTLGRLYLILCDNQNAFNAFLNGIELFISAKVCVSADFLKDELDSIAKLKNIFKSTEAVEQIETILTIALYLKFEDDKLLAELKTKAIKKSATKSPVLIVAGGSASFIKNNSGKYSSYLIDAVEKYNGTIISGGTTGGIPGLLGSAVDIVRSNGNKGIQLIGYVPKKMSNKIKPHRSYKHVKTNGTEFTELEPIQMWVDLICKGIKPKEVRLLGIDGGPISSFEYRLSLALGANVGVINNSGNVVNELLLDSDWKETANLHIIPNETESVWAFVNYKITTTLTQAQLDEAAKAIHENYVSGQLDDFRNEDNLKQWDELDEKFRYSNLSQATFMIELLSKVGYTIRKAEKDGKEIKTFPKKEMITMARLEHGRFVAERLMGGWKFGEEKDVEKKISPYLISWDELSDEVRGWDINAVENFPKLLEKAGFEIILNK